MLRYSADREVSSKSEAMIERETSLKWEARCLACLRRYKAGDGLDWLLRAENARSEALEHAALVGDGGKLVGQVERRLAQVRPKVGKGRAG